MKNLEAKLVRDEKALLGEGPSWDEKSKTLFWVDIQGKKVHIYDNKANINKTIDVSESVGAVVPRKKGGAVLALEKGFAMLDLETEKIEYIVKLEEEKTHTRFNDGKCDPGGRFWAGTMAVNETKSEGSLYCLDTDYSVRKIVDNVTVSNGLAWSPDNTIMYYIDTPTRQVAAYDYDIKTGNITNKRVVVVIPETEGKPDGMTIDKKGRLWIAHWQGSQVSCWNPVTGEKLAKIELPVEKVTSCCFGGENMNELFITTARVGLDEKDLEKQPHAGGLFMVQTEVEGSKTYQFHG